jgi:uncharacterized membrane protein YqjE
MELQNRIRSDGEARPLSEIVAAVIQNVQNIFRSEVRLAIVELKQKLRKSSKAVAFLAIAGLLGFLAACCLTTAFIVLLYIVLPLWLAALLVFLAYAIAAGGAFVLGRMALEEIDPLPQQTIETLKDNLDWAKNRAK